MWIGLLAAPAAWFVQFTVGQWLSAVTCTPSGRGLPVHGWALPATVVAALVALLGGLSAFATFRATRELDQDADPPRGRIRFLGIVGMVTSPLFLFVILMGGLGALSLSTCRVG
jgi:protein-S-isoprenylcysteine O-methyltransferase Ste14